MRQKALFQLATGLGTPKYRPERKTFATRQSVLRPRTVLVDSEERSDHFVVRIRGAVAPARISSWTCTRPERLDDLDHIENTLRRCVEAAGRTLLAHPSASLRA